MWQIKFCRHQMLQDRYGNLETGTVVSVEHDWVPTFVVLPHRTIGNRWVWLKKVYIRRAWVYTGFVDEPETQYAELFDIVAESHDYA
jgi:hypothetical protein